MGFGDILLEDIQHILAGITSLFGGDRLVDDIITAFDQKANQEAFMKRMSDILVEYNKRINNAHSKAEAAKSGLKIPSTSQIVSLQEQIANKTGYRIPTSVKSELAAQLEKDSRALKQANEQYERDVENYNRGLERINNQLSIDIGKAETIRGLQESDASQFGNAYYEFEKYNQYDKLSDSPVVNKLKEDY